MSKQAEELQVEVEVEVVACARTRVRGRVRGGRLGRKRILAREEAAAPLEEEATRRSRKGTLIPPLLRVEANTRRRRLRRG